MLHAFCDNPTLCHNYSARLGCSSKQCPIEEFYRIYGLYSKVFILQSILSMSNVAQVLAKNIDHRKATFVICQDCFWCASCLGTEFFHSCPSCSSYKVEPLPVFADESFNVGFSTKRNIDLSFGRQK